MMNVLKSESKATMTIPCKRDKVATYSDKLCQGSCDKVVGSRFLARSAPWLLPFSGCPPGGHPAQIWRPKTSFSA